MSLKTNPPLSGNWDAGNTPFLSVNQDDETITVYGHSYSFSFFKVMGNNKDYWIHVDKYGTFRPYSNLVMPIPEVQDGDL